MPCSQPCGGQVELAGQVHVCISPFQQLSTYRSLAPVCPQAMQHTAATLCPHLGDTWGQSNMAVLACSPGFLAASMAKVLPDLPGGHTHASRMGERLRDVLFLRVCLPVCQDQAGSL